MRLHPIAPDDLTSDQKDLYLDMRTGIARHFKGFMTERADGARFGQRGANELIYLVALYSLVCTTLNGFDVPVPAHE